MIITFDIGGTAIKYGIINSSESFIYKHSIPTQANLGGHAIIFRLIALINELKKPYDITGVAISSAGVIDAIKGIVLSATDAIPNYVGLNIKQIIETETLLPVTVENDVKCLALSELAYGNHEVDTFLTMTIGTGIGGAIVMDGKLFKGHRLRAVGVVVGRAVLRPVLCAGVVGAGLGVVAAWRAVAGAVGDRGHPGVDAAVAVVDAWLVHRVGLRPGFRWTTWPTARHAASGRARCSRTRP